MHNKAENMEPIFKQKIMNTPLYFSNGASQALVKLLISHGASVNVSSYGGMNVVAAAAKNKRTDTVTLLLKSGANCSPDWFRNAAFMIALSNDHVEMLKVLMDFGVNVRGTDPKGASIAHACCVDGSNKFLQHIISTTDIDLNSHNRQRQTAAHIASLHDNDECLLTLFQAGADCWSQDPRGHTGLEVALFHNRCKSVRFFVEHSVFPAHKLFSTLHMLQNDYDQDALSRKPAYMVFEQLLLATRGADDQVDTLLNMCVICVQRILGQNPKVKVARLPLPEKMKVRISHLQ
jgi:ankyrin repeat protein